MFTCLKVRGIKGGVIAFCLMPPVVQFALVILPILAVASVGSLWVPKEDLAGLGSEARTPAVLAGVRFGFELLICLTAMGTALLFCGLARRSAAGMGWAIAACGICALHNCFFQTRVSSHSLVLGYFWGRHDLVGPIIPLLVAFAVFVRQRRLERGLQLAFPGLPDWGGSRLTPLILLGLTTGMFTGCAGPKPVHQCGWVGGRYQTAYPRALSAKYLLAPAGLRRDFAGSQSNPSPDFEYAFSA